MELPSLGVKGIARLTFTSPRAEFCGGELGFSEPSDSICPFSNSVPDKDA